MKYLITGGCGFIGCNFASNLLKRGDNVIVLDNLSRKGSEKNLDYLKSLKKRFVFEKIDLSQDNKRLDSLVDKVEAVFDLAGQVAVTSSLVDPRYDFENNLVGTINILEAIRKSKKRPILIYSSTNKVYGDIGRIRTIELKKRYRFADLPLGVSETQQLDFLSPYGCSKGAADQYVRDYARSFALKTVVMRQSCIYGPRQFGVKDQGWVAWFIIAAVLDKKITIFGNGKQVRDLLYVDDLFNAYELAVKRIDDVKGGVFNMGGGSENTLSLLELISFLENKLNKKIEYNFSERRLGDQQIYVSDISKAKNNLDWKPKVSVKEGLEVLFNWILKNQSDIKKIINSNNAKKNKK